MTEVLTSAQMRAIERAAIDSGAVTGLELMERAGAGVVAAMLAEWPDLADGPHRAVVLCGPGNNGGDGFVVARLLHGRGWTISLYLLGDAAQLPPDARVNYDRWLARGQTILGLMDAMTASYAGFEGNDVVLDALFGIGLSRPIEVYWREIIDRIDWRDEGTRAVAIDIPSGFNSDTGAIVDFSHESLEHTKSYVDAQRIAKFDMTVTSHSKKRAHVMLECMQHCGKVVVVDLGLPNG